jgi:hypothetical protein
VVPWSRRCQLETYAKLYGSEYRGADENEIPSLQQDLVRYGITPATVFPDLSGLCQKICSKWKRN